MDEQLCDRLYISHSFDSDKEIHAKDLPKKIHKKWKCHWVVLSGNISPSKCCLNYCKKENDWLSKNQSKITKCQLTRFTVRKFSGREEHDNYLIISLRTYAICLSFESITKMDEWYGVLERLLEFYDVTLQCPEHKDLEGEYVVQFSSPGPVKVWGMDGLLRWEWSLNTVRRIGCQKSTTQLEVEVGRRSSVGKGNFLFTCERAFELYWAIKTAMDLLVLQSMKSPDLQSMESPDLQSMESPDLQSMESPDLQSSESPDLQSMESPDLQPVKSSTLQHRKHVKIRALQPTTSLDLRPVQTPDLQPRRSPVPQRNSAIPLQSMESPDLQSMESPDLQPVKSPVKCPDLQPMESPDLQPMKSPDLQLVKSPDLLPVKPPALLRRKLVKIRALRPMTSPDLQLVLPPALQPRRSPVPQRNSAIQPANTEPLMAILDTDPTVDKLQHTHIESPTTASSTQTHVGGDSSSQYTSLKPRLVDRANTYEVVDKMYTSLINQNMPSTYDSKLTPNQQPDDETSSEYTYISRSDIDTCIDDDYYYI